MTPYEFELWIERIQENADTYRLLAMLAIVVVLIAGIYAAATGAWAFAGGAAVAILVLILAILVLGKIAPEV